MHAIVSSMHLFWTQLYLYYASAMYMQKYFDIVNYVRLYSSYLANKMHTEKIHVQYIYFTSNFVAVSARVWLIVVYGCSFVFFAYILYLHFSLRDLCSWDIIRLI